MHDYEYERPKSLLYYFGGYSLQNKHEYEQDLFVSQHSNN